MDRRRCLTRRALIDRVKTARVGYATGWRRNMLFLNLFIDQQFRPVR
ncbi:MAG: hypothetical protein QOG67_2310, partial [Verrucomicrobiota bacterium]